MQCRAMQRGRARGVLVPGAKLKIFYRWYKDWLLIFLCVCLYIDKLKGRGAPDYCFAPDADLTSQVPEVIPPTANFDDYNLKISFRY